MYYKPINNLYSLLIFHIFTINCSSTSLKVHFEEILVPQSFSTHFDNFLNEIIKSNNTIEDWAQNVMDNSEKFYLYLKETETPEYKELIEKIYSFHDSIQLSNECISDHKKKSNLQFLIKFIEASLNTPNFHPTLQYIPDNIDTIIENKINTITQNLLTIMKNEQSLINSISEIYFLIQETIGVPSEISNTSISKKIYKKITKSIKCMIKQIKNFIKKEFALDLAVSPLGVDSRNCIRSIFSAIENLNIARTKDLSCASQKILDSLEYRATSLNPDFNDYHLLLNQKIDKQKQLFISQLCNNCEIIEHQLRPSIIFQSLQDPKSIDMQKIKSKNMIPTGEKLSHMSVRKTEIRAIDSLSFTDSRQYSVQQTIDLNAVTPVQQSFCILSPVCNTLLDEADQILSNTTLPLQPTIQDRGKKKYTGLFINCCSCIE